MKALIIREPWISLILSGRKTWEMRSRPTKVRGKIGLIRAGSGLIVGTADLADCRERIDLDEMLATSSLHCITDPYQVCDAMNRGWNVPWVLKHIWPSHPAPIPYKHPQGAVTWVNVEVTP